MRLRSMLVAAMATLAIAVSAAPALAHEEINPKTFPTGQPTFLTLTKSRRFPPPSSNAGHGAEDLLHRRR